ncbi:hypothetical protein EZS27_023218 [termite gut metagenome]|uniref:Gamma-butyrobetaine hydroxylase-like N-terminal domain-containing protein n=1 Tax=termite gut metagenome TaxID=433724 RepID=A0A5J4R2Q4_9ZZZZ
MMGEISLIRIIDVEYIKDYTMRLEFSDGTKKVVDFFHC